MNQKISVFPALCSFFVAHARPQSASETPELGAVFPTGINPQSVGQIIGDVLKQLDDDRFIVKASSGPRYVVGCRNKLDKAALKPGTRVSLDMTTLTIMRKLPREVRWCGREIEERQCFRFGGRGLGGGRRAGW